MNRRSRSTAIIVASALMGALLWIGAAYRADVARARARVAAGSQVIATACGPIEYADVGSGPPMLMIHGAGGGFDQGLALAASFAPGEYRVIAPSRFGYLRTPAPEYATAASQADAHACLLDALGLHSVVVVGVSAGAPSALEFALRHAERSRALVLVVPGWYPSVAAPPQRVGPIAQKIMDWALRSDFMFWAFAKALPAAASKAVLAMPPEVVASASPAEQARVTTILWDVLPISQRAVGLSREARLTVAPLSAPLEQIHAPTLVVSAQDDLYGTWNNAQFIHQGIPNSRFIGFPTGGHLLVGHSAEVTSAISRLLKENASDVSR